MQYDVMDRVYSIYIDIMSGISSGSGSAVFYNTDNYTSFIEVAVKNGNQDLDMTQYKYILVVNKPDGTTYKNEYTENTDSSKLVIELDSQLLSGVGTNKAQLYVTKTVDTKDKVVTMVEFNYIVKKANYNELASESTNVDALYTKLRNDVDYILENGVSGGSSENKTIVDVGGTSGNIQLTTDKYQYLDADGDVNLLFPIAGDTEVTEIHLFYTGSYQVTAGSPDLVWEEKPNITENSHIEFIFTKYKGFWLGRFINYGGISGGGSSTPIELPRIFFEGDITGMSKEVSKDVTFTYMDKSTEFKGVANLKWQGNSSINFPKKNFTMKMYKDSSKAKKLKHDFGWGNESKYVLKANYIDHTHARNIVSARIWSKIVASRPDYESLPTLMKESPNNCAVDGFPIKLYMNGKYEGLYTLNIPKDAWMFNMDDTLDEHCVLCSENYVSGNFRGTPLLNGSDWSDEVHDRCPAIIKNRWKAVVDFVMNSTDEEFKANLDQYFDVLSLIDYYIFHYFNCGLDAFGKNQLYATYDGNLWYACSYDMDSTWGLYYNGTKFVSEEYRCQEDYESSINNRGGNLLYIRLADMFPTEIYTRYKQLRKDVLALPNIAIMFEDFCYKIPSNLYDEDVQIYTGIPNNKTSNVTQIRNYAAARAIYVDAQMELLAQTNAYTITNNLTNVSNSNSATSINDGEAYSATLTADTNYTLGDVTVTMGEEDITSTVYSNGTITIESVTGNIVITATAIQTSIPCTKVEISPSTLTLTSVGSKGTFSGTKTPSNTTDTATWSSDNTSVATVSKGIVTAVGKGTATITLKCGSATATATVTVDIAEETTTYNVTNTLSNCSNNNPATSVNEGESYSAVISANNGYDLGTIKVTMGGTDISPSAVSGANISISTVTGNIVITATATASSSGGGTGDPNAAIISRAAYSLPSEVIFDGTNAVDTGVRLFDEDKDWSVYLEFEGSSSPMDGATEPYRILLHSMEETAPYKGFYFGLRNNLKKYALNEATANKELYIDKKRTATQKIIIYHRAGENKIYARYPSDDTTISDHNRTDSLTSSYVNITNSSTVVLGGYKKISGEFGRYWKGTLDKCYIWNEVLSADEMTAMVGTIE